MQCLSVVVGALPPLTMLLLRGGVQTSTLGWMELVMQRHFLSDTHKHSHPGKTPSFSPNTTPPTHTTTTTFTPFQPDLKRLCLKRVFNVEFLESVIGPWTS